MISCRPLTRARWSDLETLFGERGACGGCWCMWFRLPKKEYEAGKHAGNRSRLRTLVESGAPTGILGYDRERPVGWCSVAPRAQYLRLRTTRTMLPADGRPLWTILCLFVASSHRRSGVSVELIRAAARWAVGEGAPGVEAFPITGASSEVPAAFASQGLLSAYLQAGFTEVRRASATRVVVRWTREAAPPGTEIRA